MIKTSQGDILIDSPITSEKDKREKRIETWCFGCALSDSVLTRVTGDVVSGGFLSRGSSDIPDAEA